MSAPDALRLRGVTRTYGRGDAAVVALRDVDLRVPHGTLTAVMGPSGSGKSTLLQVAAGLDTPSSGEVWVGGRALSTLSENERTVLRRDHIGVVFQQGNLLPAATAAQNITLPLDLAGRPVDRERFDHLVEVLGLHGRLRHRPTQLSGGQQQRVAIARALVGGPELVLADEPTGALDLRSGAEVLELLRTAVREMGATVVLVTHDPAAAVYAERVVLLADGRLSGEILSPTTATVVQAVTALEAEAAGQVS